MNELSNGQVVISKAGRDKGTYYIVMACQENYVLVADGVLRRVDHLKKKKIKHLQPTKEVIDEIGYKIRKHLKLTNLEIRQSLDKYNKPEQQ